ncbi:uncharacterized protein Z520_05021 [Fonsecaea multimorphosa CBS 102226]|uniref:PIG-P domain-containing protein n=1 Tax=Fonsecaea multimorphosa CBS 102226 TaxID=1442371 RepID=A0A0D2HC53_9EURO|nr:uncharacterized protein Z520_05021 [Fonsecaea multimorphosa CBS 102226]KIX99445.1 hypothetical protein Z520_05021 [Fonsecaea multimorphosa CBS 102226]OAL25770.1 hypothetical protein AYO22_04759 [Fonsecaea multimorphosa]
MPPQSRGGSPALGPRPYSKSDALPPTLRPYLENLPSPTALIPSDQRTPTGPRMIVPDRDISTPTPSPQRSRAATAFELGAEAQEISEDGYIHALPPSGRASPLEESGLEQEGVDLDMAGVTLDDDDFESHYSRQESSASDDEGDEVEADGEIVAKENENYDDEEQQDQDGAADPGEHRPPASERPDSLSRVRSLPARPTLSQTSVHFPAQHPREGLHTSQSTTALPPPPPPPLYPPFYNRPPTPLPPSPSLTSLLRPPSLLNRSTASTRPTTPDSSDAETPNDTEAAVAHSARRAHPVPPTSPKVPTYEYYGFVLYLASTLAFLIYILWSYLPSPFLHALGITYYPNRWWSLAIPAWIVMLLIFIYVALLSYNVEYLTLPLTSLECMVDDAANVAILDGSGRIRKGGSKRLVKELEERVRLERDMETARTKSGKGRKSSRAGVEASHRSKDKGKRKPSRASIELPPPSEIRAWDYQSTASAHSAKFSLRNDRPTANSYNNPPMYPFIPTTTHSTRTRADYETQEAYPTHPNWKLVWNEGTDAVMDVPIGGVCEVLYG